MLSEKPELSEFTGNIITKLFMFSGASEELSLLGIIFISKSTIHHIILDHILDLLDLAVFFFLFFSELMFYSPKKVL